MAKNIGATLSLKNGNFFTGLKSALSATDNFKNKLSGVTSTLKNHSSQLSNVGNGLKSLAGKVVGAIAAYASIRQIVSFTNDCIAAANAQTAAEQRLQQTMSNVSGTTQAQIDSIKAYAATLQGLTTIGDEVAIHGASQLATFQLQGDTIKTLMPALEDLAVAQYGVSVSSDQMQSMANLVGKVMTGSTSALTRYGVVMNDTQQKILKTGTESQKAAVLVDVLKQNFGGLAEAMANTPEGRIEQLKNAWGDMKEVIGAQLYPLITSLLTWATDKIPMVQNILSNVMKSLQPLFSWFGNSALPMIDNAISSVINAGQKIYKTIAPSLKKLKNAFDVVKNSVSEAFENSAVGNNIVNMAGNIISAFSEMSASIMTALSPVLPYIIDMAGNMISAFSEISVSIMTALSPVLPDIIDICGSIADVISVMLPPITQVVTGIVQAVGPLLKEISSGLKDVFSQLGPFIEALMPRLQPIIDFLSKVANIVMQTLGPAISNIITRTADTINIITSLLNGDFKGVVEGVKTLISDVFNGIVTNTVNRFNGLVGIVGAVFNLIVDNVTIKFNTIKNIAIGIFESIKTGITGKIQQAKDLIVNIFESIKTKIADVWNGIKGLIKTPHIVQKGTISIAGISTPIPQLGIEWNAMGGIMNRPTAFGVAGGKVQMGGEAGPEAILPLKPFWDKLDKALKQKTESGRNSINIDLDVNINADNRNPEDLADQVINAFVPKLKMAMANL